MHLLDTNTVIYYLNAALPTSAMVRLHTIVDAQCYISTVTKIEVLGFHFSSAAEQTVFEAFVAGSTVLPLSDMIVDATISLRKIQKIKVPDAIIGATALVNGFTLLSRNLSDFKNIVGLNTIDPYTW